MNLPRSLLAVLSLAGATAAAKPPPPNIVIIYADDIGYGDLSCYGATAVHTPHVDQLASEGIRFTSGYAAASTCTPSRFSLLTGEYAFRQKGTNVLGGDARLIIAPGRPTIASVLRQAGYATAVIGKWHLGLGNRYHPLDWNGVIAPGPLEVGFDQAFIIPATPDRVPCVYVQDHRVFNLDPHDPIYVNYRRPFPGEFIYPEAKALGLIKMDASGRSKSHRKAVINGIPRMGYMIGGKSALWHDDTIEEVLVQRAERFIAKEQHHRFFLYYASHDIHVPRVPNSQFVGQTTMGPRGDEIVEFDWAVGRILATLDRLHLTDNTLVILSSDNGPVLDDGYKDGAVQMVGHHRPGGPFRGGKYSLFEAGTRVPLIVRWPGHTPAGAVSDAIVSQVDFLATLAALTGQPPPGPTAPDSRDLRAALIAGSPHGRDEVIEATHSLAIRQGDWKYIEPVKDGLLINGGNETGRSPKPQLYHVSVDRGEKHNLATQYPQRVAELAALLQRERARAHTPAP